MLHNNDWIRSVLYYPILLGTIILLGLYLIIKYYQDEQTNFSYNIKDKLNIGNCKTVNNSFNAWISAIVLF